ncbi:hypothetical protein O7599_21440 [Streptomyces sp. WMMC500]|uniref:hypothetical protein n=1 Tax=Streptomyces sp. WMMC500 TaxID=3015154 RepID=UPI00248CDD59|nr:hypothetical protein [Streptomyces sp. WMMC500]WBB58205.1 hypothetical protein O7599_21440 [Streptomyces sp. WMMC500]
MAGNAAERAGSSGSWGSAGPSGHSGSSGAASVEEERALRALLERAVPRQPAPAERMERIRGRVLRRRRRRRGVWGATVTAAAVGMLLTQVLPADDPAPRHASPAAGTGTAEQREAETRLPELSDLTLQVPAGWSSRTVRTDSPKGEYVGYVASLALRPSPEPCPTGADGTCTTPPRQLPRRGTLITLQLLYGPEKSAPGLRAREVGKACVVAGGTEELWAVRRPAGAAEGVWVLATVCLATPATGDVAEARTVLGSMRFDPAAQPTHPRQPQRSER